MAWLLHRDGAMEARWLVLSVLLAGCTLDDAHRDRQIIDVHAERQDDGGVLLHVFVKNLGNGISGASNRSRDEYCVEATWARDGSIIATKEECKRETLWPDHVGVLKILAHHIPREGRVVVRLGMKNEDCPDCFQDESDGEWTLLSP